MKEYKVYWTKSAKKDLKNIIEFIKKDSYNIAQNIYTNIKEESKKLSFMSERKRVVPELKALGITKYREIVYKKWRIIFKIENRAIYVIMLIDSRRDIKDLLFQRVL